MVNLASKQTFKVVEYILEKKEFTQYSAKKDLKVAMGTVNNCFGYLLEKNFIRKTDKNYVLENPVGLIEAVSFFRSMKDLLLFEFESSYEKADLEKKLPKNAVFCLESALAGYSNYYVSSVISVYLSKKQVGELKKKLDVGVGSRTLLRIFEEKPFISKKIEINKRLFTGKVRTIIDLACDRKCAMADKLIEQLYGASNE